MLIRLIVLIGIIYCAYCMYCKLMVNKPTEEWVDYTLKPYGYELSGSDPVHYYNLPRYRKPFRWPFKFFQSYPNNHMSPLH